MFSKFLKAAQTLKMVEIEYIIELEPEWEAMASLLRGKDYQKKLLYDVREDLNQELKQLLPGNYLFLRKDVPLSSVQEQNFKLAQIRIMFHSLQNG